MNCRPWSNWKPLVRRVEARPPSHAQAHGVLELYRSEG